METPIDADFDLFEFFELTPDLVCIVNKDGFFKKVNNAVINKLGYTLSELYSQPVSSFIYHEDKEETKARRGELLAGKILQNFTNRYIAKSGQIVWLEWTSIYFSEKELVFATAKDVTERKLIETEVEENFQNYKKLANHFKINIEKDKKYLAYELHEEVAQLVAALKMEIDWLGKNMEGLNKASKQRIDRSSEISTLLIKAIQRISFSISPNLIDDFGLTVTLEWLCSEFTLLNKIPCTIETSYDERLLTNEMKIDFFRICQEALNNITKHAAATKINISIQESKDQLQLCIKDNGRGFDMQAQKEHPGIIRMQGRAFSINANLAISSMPGEGTSVCLNIDKKQLNVLSDLKPY